MTNNKLAGKVIVVTGGTGVLGYAFNKALAAAGASVAIIGRRKEMAEQRAIEIMESGGKAIGIAADVLDEPQLLVARDIVLSTFGKIDGLINAAGGNMKEAVVQSDDDLFAVNIEAMKKVLDLNLMGTLLPTQLFGKAMVTSTGAGSIVNISSVSAHQALSKVMGYSIAKSAIEGYTKWFAVELGTRYRGAIRMNALVPGFFLTEQNRDLLTNADGSHTQRGKDIIQNTPFGRFGDPDELTGALVWLLSDESKFVNGASIVVDGGFLANSGV